MRYLRDITGPCRGRIREYFDHAADHAVDFGFAVEVSPAEVDAYLRGEGYAGESDAVEPAVEVSKPEPENEAVAEAGEPAEDGEDESDAVEPAATVKRTRRRK